MILSQTYCTEQAGLRRRVTILRVMVEPRGSGMALFTLRAAEEVQSAQFGSAEGDLDVEMVAIARSIIRQRRGTFDPSTYRDRYQEALRGLIETKLKGLPIKPREVITPPPVIDLMAALKRSLAQETPAIGAMRAKPQKRASSAADRRQRSLLLPVAGGRKGRRSPRPSRPPSPRGGERRPERRHEELLREGTRWLY